MIIRRSLVLLFLLAETFGTPVSYPNSPAKFVDRLEQEGNILIEMAQRENYINAELSQLSLYEIIEQGDALRTSTIEDDIKTIVNKLDSKLAELLKLGVPPLGVVPIINCFFFNVEDLVLTAKEIQARVLLGLLQLLYIWRDDAQFHWFQAMSYLSPWYDETMWNTHPMDWKNNVEAICQWDNGALAGVIMQKGLSGDFDEEELLILCARYDAIKVFTTIGMKPIRLQEHLELLSINCSAKLLQLYQASNKELTHLHLEDYSFPSKLPASVEDFAFLIRHGHDCFPMDHFIDTCCREGRLDLLIFLHDLDPRLVPVDYNLKAVAEKGQLDILKWIHQSLLHDNKISQLIMTTLATNCHFQALDWWINANSIAVHEDTILVIIRMGILEALEWIGERQPLVFDPYWVGMAALDCHFPILKWLYEKFKALPSISYLRYITVEILEWLVTVGDIKIDARLLECVAGNFELLKWIHKNAHISLFEENKKTLSGMVRSREMMLWLHDKLGTCKPNMNWAYEEGDLESIQWAKENCQITPSGDDLYFAATRGHLHIIKWIKENCAEYLQPTHTFFCALRAGWLEITDYLISDADIVIEHPECLNRGTLGSHRLDVIKWAFKNNIAVDQNRELFDAAFKGDLQTLMWYFETFPNVNFPSETWHFSVKNNHPKVYEWLLYNVPDGRPERELNQDFQQAFIYGHLEVVKVILGRMPSLVGKIAEFEITSKNYHIKQWLITHSLGK